MVRKKKVKGSSVSKASDARELSAGEVESARRVEIRRNMGLNGGKKEHCKAEVLAGRRDPRSKK